MVSPGNYTHAGLRVHAVVRDGEGIEGAISRASKVLDRMIPIQARRVLSYDEPPENGQRRLDDGAAPDDGLDDPPPGNSTSNPDLTLTALTPR